MQYQEVERLLSAIEGATFAGLDTSTVPVLKGGKANPMQGKIKKLCTGSRVMLFTNKQSNAYENKVRRHLEKEGKNPESFKLGALPWGERLPNSPIIHNKGKYYIQVIFLKAGAVEYRATQEIIFNEFMGIGCTHYSEGDFIPKANIPGLDDRSGSEHQGLEDEVIVRAYALDSIIALRAFGDELQ